jgi:hypothetical protein
MFYHRGHRVRACYRHDPLPTIAGITVLIVRLYGGRHWLIVSSTIKGDRTHVDIDCGPSLKKAIITLNFLKD